MCWFLKCLISSFHIALYLIWLLHYWHLATIFLTPTSGKIPKIICIILLYSSISIFPMFCSSMLEVKMIVLITYPFHFSVFVLFATAFDLPIISFSYNDSSIFLIAVVSLWQLSLVVKRMDFEAKLLASNSCSASDPNCENGRKSLHLLKPNPPGYCELE